MDDQTSKVWTRDLRIAHKRGLQQAPHLFDFLAGLVVFLVALPMSLGIAHASGMPMARGLIAGAIGGIVVGLLSKSQTSVSGPAAGLILLITTESEALGGYDRFAIAVAVAGAIQMVAGRVGLGFIARFLPSSVVRGTMTAIGILLVLKQLPHVLGHDTDPLGDLEFFQSDGRNTLSELTAALVDIHYGPALIGIVSLVALLMWEKLPTSLRRIPSALVVLAGGALATFALQNSDSLQVVSSHRVALPPLEDFQTILHRPDFRAFLDPRVYAVAFSMAIALSLESLLSLEAIDKLDPHKRRSPPGRELVAQGIGNVLSGLLGGLPITSLLARSTVNLNVGARSGLSTVVHGFLFVVAAIALPAALSYLPLASVAAILLFIGYRLAHAEHFTTMRKGGRSQFIPFAATVFFVLFGDLLIGTFAGLVSAGVLVLYSNYRRPVRKRIERHAEEDVVRIALQNQVGFFRRAQIGAALDAIPAGGHVLLDARQTDYIDPDVYELLREFRDETAPARNIEVSFLGFKDHYADLPDKILYVDYTSRDLQSAISPAQVLELLQKGNERFLRGEPIEREHLRQVEATAAAQAPLAVILSCMDSRTPSELIFDLGIGDAFNVRIAGNVLDPHILGSLEYGCRVAGAKLIAVIGHTSCGAIKAAVASAQSGETVRASTNCEHIDGLLAEVTPVIDVEELRRTPEADLAGYIDAVSKRNVARTMEEVRVRSAVLRDMLDRGQIAIAGGLYDVHSGSVTFFE